jgi:hypothetical protein
MLYDKALLRSLRLPAVGSADAETMLIMLAGDIVILAVGVLWNCRKARR